VVSAATVYLQNQITKASTVTPSVTWITLQRSTAPPNQSSPHPALAGYGWGVNGFLVKDRAGRVFGLGFDEVHQWFSDRVASSGGSLADWQRFDAKARDLASVRFLLEGDVVRLFVALLTWKSVWESVTATLDAPSQQLVFSSVPGAGPNAPPAVMLASIASTGRVNEL
jgi:hypothetical protein